MSDHVINQEVACNCETRSRVWLWWRTVRNAVGRWLFLYVWCRRLYRPAMKLLHRFNLHYAPPDNPLGNAYGLRHHWCQWCGLRGSTWKFDPSKGIDQLLSHEHKDHE